MCVLQRSGIVKSACVFLCAREHVQSFVLSALGHSGVFAISEGREARNTACGCPPPPLPIQHLSKMAAKILHTYWCRPCKQGRVPATPSNPTRPMNETTLPKTTLHIPLPLLGSTHMGGQRRKPQRRRHTSRQAAPNRRALWTLLVAFAAMHACCASRSSPSTFRASSHQQSARSRASVVRASV